MKIYLLLFATSLTIITVILPSTAQWPDQQQCQLKRKEVLKKYYLAEQVLAEYTEAANVGAIPEIQVQSRRAYRDGLLKQLKSPYSCSSTQLKTTDTLIIPGKRFGIITAKTTYQDLVKSFGKTQLTDKEFWGAEDETKFMSTDVDLGADLSFTVVWKDDRRNAPSQVFTSGSKWHTAENIHVGLSFLELQNILGEFQVSGMEWDYGNQVIIDQSRWKKHFDRFFIYIAVGQDNIQKFPKDYEAVLGEQSIASSSPHWNKLKPYIFKLTLYF